MVVPAEVAVEGEVDVVPSPTFPSAVVPGSAAGPVVVVAPGPADQGEGEIPLVSLHGDQTAHDETLRVSQILRMD